MFALPKRHDRHHTKTKNLLDAMMNGVQSYLQKNKNPTMTVWLDSIIAGYDQNKTKKLKNILTVLRKEFSYIGDIKEDVTYIRLQALFLLKSIFYSNSDPLILEIAAQLLGISHSQLMIFYQDKQMGTLKKILSDPHSHINTIFDEKKTIDAYNKSQTQMVRVIATLSILSVNELHYLNRSQTMLAIEKLAIMLSDATSISEILQTLKKAALISDSREVELTVKMPGQGFG